MNLLKVVTFLSLLFTLAFNCKCQQQCNSVIRQKRAVIKNPTQVTTIGTCRYTVEPASGFVCQLRIDFNRFELAQPALNASTNSLDCVDYLRVNNFKLCGRNTGQHLYVPLQRKGAGTGSGALVIDFVLGTHWSQSSWQLTLTQFDCPGVGSPLSGLRLPFFRTKRTIFSSSDSGALAGSVGLLPALIPNIADYEFLAPLGCDQYYSTNEGKIRSFNNMEGGVLLPSLTYTICVKSTSRGEIEYMFNRFSFATNAQPGYDEDCHATIHTEGRYEQYLMIPQSRFVNNANMQPTYYCGDTLRAATIKARSPFVMHVAVDAQNADTSGFDLSYKVQSFVSTV